MSKFTLPVLLITTSLGIGAAYSALGDGAPLSNLDSGISSNFSMNVRTVAADALEPGSSALTLVENNQSGIHNTTHTAVDEYGNIFGFRFDGIYNNGDIEIVDPNTGEVTGYRPGYEIQNLQLCGVTAINAKTATIPDSVAISYEWYVVKAPVTDAQLYYPLSEDSSFLDRYYLPDDHQECQHKYGGNGQCAQVSFPFGGGTVFQLLQWCRHQNQHLCSKRISANLPRCT